MIKKIVLSLVVLLSACGFAYAQVRQVSGTVTDASGEPIIGAAVVIEGTTTGTSTNISGQYSMDVPANATLVISSLGYETAKVPVAGKTTVNAVLKDEAVMIEDLVVLGYGSGRKVGTVIGSVDKVKSDKLENRPSNNVVDALQGQVAGLTIMTGNGELSTTSTIRIRGLGSISASTTPLILLDGAPISSSTLLAMNSNDIESVNVLKDASATSIYGSRAANGVIYVASKRGKRGAEGIDVTLRTQYSMSSAPRRKMTPMNTDQYLDYAGALLIAGGNMGNNYSWTDPDDIATARALFVSMSGIDDSVNTDWYNELISKNTPMYQVDLSISGGSERSSYYISGNYLDQTGIMPGSELSRYTFRSNVDTRVNDWVRTGLSMGLTYQESAQASTAATRGALVTSNPLLASYLIQPYQRCYDENGELVRYLNHYNEGNPLLNPELNPDSDNQIFLNGSAFIELTPAKGFTIRSQLSATAYDARSMGRFSPAWPVSSNENGEVVEAGTGNASESFSRSYSWTWTNTAEYKTTIARNHHLTALVGEETIYSSTNGFAVGVRGITSSAYVNLSMGTETQGLPSYSISKYAYNSVFGRLEYDFKERYFFDVSVRNDACSRFGTNNRSAVFYAVGGMWKISNEAFLRGNRAITDFDLRVTYGTQGNSAISNYAQYEFLSADYAYDGQTAWSLTSMGNPNLGWEKQTMLSVGANIEFLRKIQIGVEYYNRTSSDLLMDIPLAPSTGFTTRPGNMGKLRNAGIDISLNYDIYATKDWFISLYANFNYNKNTLVETWQDGVDRIAAGDYIYYIKGKPLRSYYVQEYRGVNPETGQPMWTADTEGGTTTNFNEAILVDLDKSNYAPYTGGFGFQAQWKGLALMADFSWTAGNYLVNNNYYFTANTAFALQYNQDVSAMDYWKQPGDNAKYPSLAVTANSQSTYFDSSLIEDGSFLRLKNIQLSYTLPSHLLQKSRFIKGLKLFVGARNLFTITSYSGNDPEVSESVFDADIYPNTRQWTFGLEFKF